MPGHHLPPPPSPGGRYEPGRETRHLSNTGLLEQRLHRLEDMLRVYFPVTFLSAEGDFLEVLGRPLGADESAGLPWLAFMLPSIGESRYCSICHATVDGTVPDPIGSVGYPGTEPPNVIGTWNVSAADTFNLVISATNPNDPDPPDAGWVPTDFSVHYGAVSVPTGHYGIVRQIAVVDANGNAANALTRSLETAYCPALGLKIGGV